MAEVVALLLLLEVADLILQRKKQMALVVVVPYLSAPKYMLSPTVKLLLMVPSPVVVPSSGSQS
eukprot:39309-Amphidinium_carterae.2